MPSSAEELILRISGDATGAQEAMQQVSAAMAGLKTQVDSVSSSTGTASADLKKLKDDLHGPHGLAGGAKEAQEAVKQVKSGLSDLLVPAVAAANVAALLAKALYDIGQKAIETGASIQRVSLSTNMTAEAVSDLKFAFDATGGSLEQVERGMSMFEQRMANSSTTVGKGLELIGLHLSDIAGMGQDQRLLAISTAFRATGEDVNRAAAAVDIFGQGARDMIPLLMQDLSGLVQRSKDLGNTWSTEDAQAADAFASAVTKMAAESASAWDQLGRIVMPVTGTITEGWAEAKAVAAGTALGMGQLAEKGYEVGRAWLAMQNGELLPWLRSLQGELPAVAKGLGLLADGSGAAAKGLQDMIAKATQHVPVVLSEKDAIEKLKDGLREQQAQVTKSIIESEKFAAAEAAVTRAMEYLKVGVGAAEEGLHELLQRIEQTTHATTSLTSSAIGARQGFGQFGALLPDLSQRTADFAEQFALLASTANEFHNGISIAGDTLSTVTLPMFATLMPGALQQTTKAFDVARVATFSFGDEITLLSNDLRHLGQVSGNTFGGLVRDIGTAIAAYKLAADSLRQFEAAKAQGNKVGMASALVGAYGPAVSMGANADTSAGFHHTMMTGLGLDSASGVATTVALGIATAGISVGVQAAVAGLKYLFRDRTMEDIYRDAGNDFGTAFSESTAEAIKKNVKGGFSFQSAELIHLSDIIKDAGGLTEKNLPLLTARLHDVFSMIETHQFTIEQGAAVIDDNWQAFVAAGTDGNGRLSKSLKEIIDLNERFGTQSKQIGTYIQGQAQTAASGFDAMAIALRGDQSSLAALGAQAIATFATMVASGKSEAEALAAIGPGLDALILSYEDLGLQVTDVGLSSLIMQEKINKGNPTLMAGIAGLSASMVALDNIGLMNIETFVGMEQTGMAMYTRLQAQVASVGGTTKDALVPMQAYLHEAQVEAKLLGVPLDDNTEELIRQSKELGVWREAGKTANDVLLDGMTKLVDKVSALIDQLNGVPHPRAPWADWPTPPELPDYGGGQPDYAGGQAWGGAYHVTRPTLFLAGERPGGEDVLFSGSGKRFAGSGLTVNVTVQGSLIKERELYATVAEGVTHYLTLRR